MTQFQTNPPPSFRIVAIMAVVWMAFGCMSYLMHVRMGPEAVATLPQGQQQFMAMMPGWLYALFAVATWSGLIGAVLMLLRKRLAVPFLLVSWIAAAAQMVGSYMVLPGLELLGGPRALIMPVIIVALGIIFWRYAMRGAAKGWLV